MADTALNIGVQTSAQLGGLNQTVAAINQVTAAQQKQAAASAQAQQGTGVASQFSGAVLGGLGVQTSIGGAVAAVIGFTKVLIDSAGRTRDFAEQLNLTTGEFQRLERAASETGVPFNRLIGSLGLLDQQRKAAAEGNLKLRDAFAAVGISMDDLNNESLRAVDLQGRLAAATTSGTEAQRTAVKTLLGAQGARLLPAMQAMQELKDKDMASAENLQRVDEYGKTWERTWARVKIAGLNALGEMMGGMQEFMGGGKDPSLRPNLARDEADYQKQVEKGTSGNARGPGKRFREFRDYQEAQRKAAADADEAARKAQADADQADTDQFNLDPMDAVGREAKGAVRDANYAEVAKQKALRDAGNQNAAIGYDDFHRDRPDLAPAAPGSLGFEDQAAAKAMGELDKQRLENAEKRRKLEFDMLTPAQQRADIENRMRDRQERMAFMSEGVEKEQEQGKILDLQGELAGMDKKKDSGSGLGVNQWEKMGAGFGGGQDKAGEQVRLQQDIKQNTDRANQQLAALNVVMQNTLSFWHQ